MLFTRRNLSAERAAKIVQEIRNPSAKPGRRIIDTPSGVAIDGAGEIIANGHTPVYTFPTALQAWTR